MCPARAWLLRLVIAWLAAFAALPLLAQEARWDELSTQVSGLIEQGKFAEALPPAEEALKVADATFGSDDTRSATSALALGVLYQQKEDYARAEPLYRRSLATFDKALGPDNPISAKLVLALAVTCHKQKKYAEAEPLYQRLLRQYEATAPENPDLAVLLSDLAAMYLDQDRYSDAEPLLQRALAILQKGPEDLNLAVTLNNLGDAYFRLGKYPEAEAALARALQVYEKNLGPQDPQLLLPLSNLARMHTLQGKFAAAEQEAKRTVEILQKAGADPPALARALNTLGLVYDEEGKYPQAEALFQQAIALQEKSLAADHPDLAASLNNLAMLDFRQGKYEESAALYGRAIAGMEKALGPDSPDLATAVNNLAELRSQQGQYAEAERLYQRALAIRERALGPEHPDVAASLMGLALVYISNGRYAQAEAPGKRALAILEKSLGPQHPLVAKALNNLAMGYFHQGKYDEAEPLYLRALEILQKSLGPDHDDVALTLNNLALLYSRARLYPQVEQSLERALQIREKVFGPDNPAVGLALNNLAGVYIEEGKYAQAEPLLVRAVDVMEKSLGPDHPTLSLGLFNLAGLRYGQQRPADAQPLYARAFAILFRRFQYQFTYMSEKERLAFLDTVSEDFPVYYSFVRQYREQNPQLVDEMYDLLLWQKGFIAGSVTSLRRQVEASGDPEALKLLDQLAAKRAQLAALLNAPPKDRDTWQRQVAQLEQEANDLERALVARSAAFAQQKKLESVTWQQVRDALKPGEAAVEFARFQSYDGKKWTDTTYYVALVVTPETRDHPQFVVLGEARQLEGAPLIEFQQGVQARGSEAETSAALPGSAAYELFWKPLEPLVGGKTRIYLSADGVLNQTPLGLIPAPDGKLLMEKYDLRLVSSTKDLLREAAGPAGNTAVLVGNPTFDLGEAPQRAALASLRTAQKPEPVVMAMLAPSDRSRDQGSGTTLPALPGTGAEVQAIVQILQQRHWQASAYTSDRALEEAVKQARSPRVLHLATHGFFLPDQQVKADRMGLGGDSPSGLEDPMLRSGLYFAGADRALAGRPTPENLDDGVLTAYEATSLNLQGTELVVLSACNTGQGDVKNGEGVFGLRRALQEAGAQAVMMSLWSVPDKETQELMTLFYGKWLGGMEKHEALRQAQLAEREVVRKRYGRDLPYYWGAFVLVGR